MIDNWGALHKDKNSQWINDVARDKYDNMKKMKDEMREKLIQEAPEGTPSDSIHVPLDDEFGIMVENLGRKGKLVNGVGVFPRTSGCISSMASSSELTDIRSQIKLLSDGFLKLQQENAQLRARLDLRNDDENLFTKFKAFIAASQEKTNNSTKSDGDISEGENTYPELEEHDLEEE
ncbi:uncharacterized protein [Malus domestica]|uniref:uncharacterized protein n=1 Tax=Malus domestica TaxID=3750 RepID=UPI0010AA3648|nr:uncharacterized protein LOC114824552 [Malus domestica]